MSNRLLTSLELRRAMTRVTINLAAPEQRPPSNIDDLTEGMFATWTDEQLFAELHTCCNPNCLTINEVIRRHNLAKAGRDYYQEIAERAPEHEK